MKARATLHPTSLDVRRCFRREIARRAPIAVSNFKQPYIVVLATRVSARAMKEGTARRKAQAVRTLRPIAETQPPLGAPLATFIRRRAALRYTRIPTNGMRRSASSWRGFIVTPGGAPAPPGCELAKPARRRRTSLRSNDASRERPFDERDYRNLINTGILSRSFSRHASRAPELRSPHFATIKPSLPRPLYSAASSAGFWR